MSAPNLTTAVEPFEGGSLVYLPLAAKTAYDNQLIALILLNFSITNNEISPVNVTSISLKFSSPPVYGPETNSGAPFPVAPNQTVVEADAGFGVPIVFILPIPTPKEFILSVTCKGYSDPAQITLPVAPYSAPNGGYHFPSSALPFNAQTSTFWFISNPWQNLIDIGIDAVLPEFELINAYGCQLDIVGFDETAQEWTSHPGKLKANANNEDYLVWGKDVRAMADGIIVEAINDVPNNQTPLYVLQFQPQYHGNLQAAAAIQSQTWQGFPHGEYGNHLYIQHGDDIVVYAFMQQGSINPAFLTPGAKVHVGDFLGLVGNSGDSACPTLHIHANKGTQPETGPNRPLPFQNVLSLDITSLSQPYLNAPWATVTGQALSNFAPPVPPPNYMGSAIWPLPWPKKSPISYPNIYQVAIDPLAILLGSDSAIYILFTLPDPPPVQVLEKQIQEAVRGMSPAQKEIALTRANTLLVYLNTLKRELNAKL